MRLFFNDNGEIVGTLEGATPELEAGCGMPSNAVGEITPDPELAARLVDPLDSLHPHDLTVENDTIVIPDLTVQAGELQADIEKLTKVQTPK